MTQAERRGGGSAPRRKGQVIFEFLIAAVLFFIILLYVLTAVNLQAGQFAVRASDSSLQAAAFRVSEQLLRSSGQWDYQGPSVSSIGFAKGGGVLEQRKLDTFSGICATNYPLVISLLDLGERLSSPQVRIMVTNSTGTVLDCGPAATEEKPGYAERVALQESGALAKLLIWVW